MLFNSAEFAVFFIVVFGLYVILDHERQNWLLLFASCYFYGTWDWRFLVLLLMTVSVDYVCGRIIAASPNLRVKKLTLALSIGSNLTVLGFFKYFNFFSDNFLRFAGSFGWKPDLVTLHIVLPIGLSFYTFQAMSYVLDIYRGKLDRARNFMDFILYVIFFPQLVAGPIERAKNLLPQVSSPRILSPDKFYEGSYLIFWGLFQKMFVADNLAPIVDGFFAAPAPYEGSKVLLAVYVFAFQIYCDFAGYSNMARGLGRCMGFEIMVNFNLPYFAKSPWEFWQRWHISLSSFLRDYLYEPLQKIKSRTRVFWGVMITMFLGGLWHGARWTYVAWGIYHGILILMYRLFRKANLRDRSSQNSAPAGAAWNALQTFIFFNFFCLGLLLFRSLSLRQALAMFKALFLDFHPQTVHKDLMDLSLQALFYIAPVFLVEFFQFKKNDLMAVYHLSSVPARAAFYCVFFYLWLIFGVEGAKTFIYFQF